MLVVGWVTPGLAEVGDGREKPPILAPGLAGAGSKVHELGLLDVAPARPRGAKATRATGTWGGMAMGGTYFYIYILTVKFYTLTMSQNRKCENNWFLSA